MAVLAAVAVWELVADPASAVYPRDYLVYPLGVRAYSMAETGTADATDVANIAYNPAIPALLSSIQATWGHSYSTYLLADIELEGIAVGGGYRRAVGESITLGGGAAFVYAQEEFGSKGWEGLDPAEWDDYDRNLGLVLAGMAGYRDVVDLALGLGVKHQNAKYNKDDEFEYQNIESTVFDAGVAIEARPIRKGGYTLVLSGGFAYQNFGGTIEEECGPHNPCFSGAGESDPPEFRRYGAGVRFASPSWSRADAKFETCLPVVTAAVNFDVRDMVRTGRSRDLASRVSVGGELGVFRMLFVRGGFIYVDANDDPRPELSDLKEATYGFGVAITWRRYHLRFDYGRADEEYASKPIERWGLSLDIGL